VHESSDDLLGIVGVHLTTEGLDVEAFHGITPNYTAVSADSL
jgi:hypothetical protein